MGILRLPTQGRHTRPYFHHAFLSRTIGINNLLFNKFTNIKMAHEYISRTKVRYEAITNRINDNL